MIPATSSRSPARVMRAMRHRWWIIAATAALGVLAASVFVWVRSSTYEAVAAVTAGPTPVGGSIANPSAADPATEVGILASTATATAVANKLARGTDPDDLLRNTRVTYVPARNVLELTHRDHDAERARAIADAFVSEYAAQREGAANAIYAAEVTRRTAELNANAAPLREVEQQIRAKTGERNDLLLLPVQSEEQRDRVRAIAAEIAALEVRRADLDARRLALQQAVAEAQRSRESRVKAAEVERTASLTAIPHEVGDRDVVLIGAVVGLAVGLLLAAVLGLRDTSAIDPGEVEAAAGALILARVVSFRRGRASGVAALIMASTASSQRLQHARESYRRLRTALHIQLTKIGRNSVIVTSTHPGEGKTVTATNLAIASAQSGKRTVLVSADLHHPSLERLLSMPEGHGLSDWLAGEAETVVQALPSIPCLSVISAGHHLAGPGELLASPRFAELIQDLEGDYDFVVLDTPPMLANADATTIAATVGGVVIVVDGHRTDLEPLRLVAAELARAGGRLIGVVHNRTPFRPDRGFLRRDSHATDRVAQARAD